MTDYNFVIQERGGGFQTELIGLSNRGYSIPLNRPPEARAELLASENTAATRLLESGTSELIIYRDGTPVETVFQLANVAVSGDSDTVRYELSWLGILSYLQSALVLKGVSYSSTAQSRIAWGFVNTFQSRTGASTYGLLDYGAPASDPTKSVLYEDDTDALDAIIALSERSNGFDFSVDAGRRFRCYCPQRGSDKTDQIVFEYGTNVSEFQLDFDTMPGSITTDVRVKGGDEVVAIVSATDAAAQATYGRREASIQYSDVITETSALQQYADAIIDERARPQAIPRLTLVRDHPTIPWGSYDVGDTVVVRIGAGIVDINNPYRIVQIHTDLDDNDNETIRLDLNEVVL